MRIKTIIFLTIVFSVLLGIVACKTYRDISDLFIENDDTPEIETIIISAPTKSTSTTPNIEIKFSKG